jgi:uncharacterized protein
MLVVAGILEEAYFLFNKMAPYLLFGYLFAGVLHIFVRTETISRHLGKSSFLSVVKASLFGIPLPLCSCSVIPAAMSLRKEGASRGAVLSFLISTPTTGVDSILATYSLLGWFFTAYRVIASFLAGVFSGILANMLLKEGPPTHRSGPGECKLCGADERDRRHPHGHGIVERIIGVIRYAFVDLLEDTGPALISGILVGGAITFFMPDSFIENYLGSGIVSMLVMLVVGIPMYVCATASIPIAAALMLKGLAPGAAFVFLVAGPATNIVTMAVVARNMGRGALAIYLGSISFSSVIMGLCLNFIWGYFYAAGPIHHIVHNEMLIPARAGLFASFLLLALIVTDLARRVLPTKGKKEGEHGQHIS